MVHAPWPFDAGPTNGMGLCLSGGGYRAMLFHLGALVRLNQLGRLRGSRRVSSVSGGSITAAVLGLRWADLRWDDDVATNLDELVVAPVFAFAGVGVDTKRFWKGLLLPGKTVSGCLAQAYDRHLFHGATRTDLPDDDAGPRFVIDATNLQTGKQFRFFEAVHGRLHHRHLEQAHHRTRRGGGRVELFSPFFAAPHPPVRYLQQYEK